MKSYPYVINPTHIVVHHSAANTTSNDFAAVVRSYWDFHVITRGWADIGYNWLVDPNGVLYEGRGDRVRGAHLPCMNAISTEICFIGNQENATPSQSGLNALKDFIAWDASDKGIDVLASSYVSALSGDMENISGHRDGYDQYTCAGCTATACPGENLYAELSNIRTDVSKYTCYIAGREVPNVPESFAVIRSNSGVTTIQIQPVDRATVYEIYRSNDNQNFNKILETSDTSIQISTLLLNEVIYFKILVLNDKGSLNLSFSLALIAGDKVSEVLIIDGIELCQADIISHYEFPMENLGRTFSSATNDAVKDGLVDLKSYKFVLWMLLDESYADDSFDKNEQDLVKDFIDNDGVFIVSGNEIGWDLVHKGDAIDKSFYQDYLHDEYIADAPNPHLYKVKDNNQVVYELDQSNNYLNNAYPDLIKPLNGSCRNL